jgi:hypothetical protein
MKMIYVCVSKAPKISTSALKREIEARGSGVLEKMKLRFYKPPLTCSATLPGRRKPLFKAYSLGITSLI